MEQQIDFSSVNRSTVLPDGRSKQTRFPERSDYIELLVRLGMIENEEDLSNHPTLNEAIYLDWLRRGQVGCIFAQLFARKRNRTNLRTIRLLENSHDPNNSSLPKLIAAATEEAVSDPRTEALTVLLPDILQPEKLVKMLQDLSRLANWSIESETPWRGTIALIGLRVEIGNSVRAEVLGMGPFDFLPPTRQCPITTLEIRTKPRYALLNKILPLWKRAHLAQLPTEAFLKGKERGIRFGELTPRLRLRILGGNDDARAKARITFAVPLAIWNALKRA